MVTKRTAIAGLLVCLGGGCARDVVENPTALFVVIDADPMVRSRAAGVVVIVRRPQLIGMGALLSRHEFRGVGVSWPLTFVVRAQDPSLRVEISAEVIAMPTMPPTPNAAPVSFARAITGYAERQTMVVPMMFWGGCTPQRCANLLTCARPLAPGPSVASDCGPAVISNREPYNSSMAYGDCGNMRYRVGSTCAPLSPPAPGDGGAGDAATPDVPPTDAGSPADVFVCSDASIQCDGGGFATSTNPMHCGACGNACATRPNTAADCAGCQCVYTCTANFGDCDGNPLNGCEAFLLVDPLNCSSCGRRCTTLADATAPACVAGACP